MISIADPYYGSSVTLKMLLRGKKEPKPIKKIQSRLSFTKSQNYFVLLLFDTLMIISAFVGA
ncbi:MAG: hypothetical protein V3V37_05635, partial [Candidatus Adiutricales bacterium]